jgi:hypothetical protein
MEMLDQKVAPPRPVAEQKLDFMRRRRIDLTTFGSRFGPTPSLARMFERANLLHVMTHRDLDSDKTRGNCMYWHAKCQVKTTGAVPSKQRG